MNVPTRSLNLIALVVLLAVVLPFVVYAVPQTVGADRGYVVLSDSMSPTIDAGDVVIVEFVDPSNVEEGDVLTFERTESDTLVTHRVIDVLERDGERQFRTKGDANEDPDQSLVTSNEVVGVVSFHIPLMGYVIEFASSGVGIVLFIIVPSVLLALSELRSLYREATSDGRSPASTADPTEGGDR